MVQAVSSSVIQTRVRALDGELGAVVQALVPDMDIEVEVEEMPAAA
jgi:hypothetical protein